MNTSEVENFPGFLRVSGPDLMNQMREQAVHCGVDVKEEEVTSIEAGIRQEGEDPKTHLVHTVHSSSQSYKTKSIIIATGASPRWLGAEDEEVFFSYALFLTFFLLPH